MPRPVSLPEILEAAQRSGQATIHTSIPGIVRAYTPATQRADVEIGVRDFAFVGEDLRDDPREYDPPLVIPSVRVQFPSGAGGYGVAFGLVPGDEVTLLFSERSTAEFESSGQPSEPLDARRHSMCHPVAIPGSLSDPKQFSTLADTAGMKVGKDGANTQIEILPALIKVGLGATDFVALASIVDSNFAALQSFLDSLVSDYVAHQHPTAATGPASPPTTPFPGTPPTPDAVGATIVKAK